LHRRAWGDQGDGTYRNPILPADYSDPDLIRVGPDYYLISSTFHLAPGMAVLHSKDLVSWSTIGYAVPDLRAIGPELGWERMNRYNHGIYAGAIRFHAGRFWVFFTSYLGEGFFVSTARDPAGPWELRQMRDGKGRPLRVMKWDDPCPFWEDDGTAYLAASKVAGPWCPHLFQMSADGACLLDADVDAMNREGPQPSGEGTIIYDRPTSEASKIYKIDGLYYLFHNEVKDGVRVGMMKRARHLFGTRPDGSPGRPGAPGAYEVRQIMRGAGPDDREPNQGGLVETESGRWYFVTHEGKGGFPDGRPLSLLPVTWMDGWPIPGLRAPSSAKREGREGREVREGAEAGAGADAEDAEDAAAAIGGDLGGGALPVAGGRMCFPQGSDDFDAPVLSPRWQWNYQPRADFWSLTERRGHLRLRAFRPLSPGDFFAAGNTLAQRTFRCGGESAVVTLKMDVTGMDEGQLAGLVHFNGGVNHARISVRREGGTRRLVYQEDQAIVHGISLSEDTAEIWLRSCVDAAFISRCQYSLDGETFVGFGLPYQLRWGNYRGDYVGIYTYNDIGDTGHVDIDWFRYAFQAEPPP
jgi:beta-xylosidase